MNEEAINKLVELKIKEHFKKEKEYYKLTKEDLIDLCIKFIKTIERCNL